jgi:hypothetical protein
VYEEARNSAKYTAYYLSKEDPAGQKMTNMYSEERSGIPALDAKIKGHVDKVMKEKPELLISDVMEAVMKEFDISALAKEPVTAIGAELISDSHIKDMLNDPVAFAVSKIYAGVMFYYRASKGTDITIEDINSIFNDPEYPVDGLQSKELVNDVNFSFPTLALAPDGVPEMDNGWPRAFTNANVNHFVTEWVTGCDTFPKTTLDPELGKACGWYVPISVRVQDNMVDAIKQIPDLNGTVYKLRITTTAGQETVAFYFTPTDGWNGIYMGPVGFNDAANGPGPLFKALNAFYAEFKKTHSSLCECFDHRASKTLYQGDVLKVLVHRNMEMVTISPAPKTNEVTVAPCGGVQCHVTLSSEVELAKFCMASNGMIYPIPVNPFAKASDGTMCWADSFKKNKVPMTFYTDAHIGEQSKNSLAIAKMYPEAWAVYEEARNSAKYTAYYLSKEDPAGQKMTNMYSEENERKT